MEKSKRRKVEENSEEHPNTNSQQQIALQKLDVTETIRDLIGKVQLPED
jgi:hypothetical protein